MKTKVLLKNRMSLDFQFAKSEGIAKPKLLTSNKKDHISEGY